MAFGDRYESDYAKRNKVELKKAYAVWDKRLKEEGFRDLEYQVRGHWRFRECQHKMTNYGDTRNRLIAHWYYNLYDKGMVDTSSSLFGLESDVIESVFCACKSLTAQVERFIVECFCKDMPFRQIIREVKQHHKTDITTMTLFSAFEYYGKKAIEYDCACELMEAGQ